MRIFLAGHKGLVGSAILRKLVRKNYSNIITAERKKLDLLDQKKVFEFLKKKKPDLVIIAAAKVGGIYHNNKHLFCIYAHAHMHAHFKFQSKEEEKKNNKKVVKSNFIFYIYI